MATLYRRPDSPNWHTKYFDADGKRVSKNTGTPRRREAEKLAAEMETEARDERRKATALPRAFAAILERAARDAADGRLTLGRAEDLLKELHRLANPNFKIVSLSDHIMDWIREQEAHVGDSAVGTYLDMHRRITKALGPRASKAPVGDLTADQVRAAMAKVKATGLKSSTVNMDLGALRRALHAAVAADLAKANVAVGVRPLPESDSTERAPFEADEVASMIAHRKTSDEWKGMIIFGAHTGLRLGDIVSLGSQHLEGGRIVIRPAKTVKSKKTVVIPLSATCIEWIGDRKGSFFPDLSTKAPGTLSTTFTRIMKSAGVARDVVMPGGILGRRSFHSLRHSFTSWLAEAEVQSDVRKKLTGHSSSGIHARYTHHDSALDRAVQSLPSLATSDHPDL